MRPTLAGVEISGRKAAVKFSPNENATIETTNSATPRVTSPGPTSASAAVPATQTM